MCPRRFIMYMDKYRLDGKVALITGGSRGIGRATALGFAEAGADVAIASRKLPDLENVAVEIKKMGRKSLPIAAHVGRMEDINNLVAKVTAEFGKIDILVNNAGTSPALASSLEVDERLWDSILNLNLKGLFFLSQTAAKVMKEHGGGKIINVASMDGFKPEANIGTYAISKAGVIMVTKVMAMELAQYNIRVNALAPGYGRCDDLSGIRCLQLRDRRMYRRSRWNFSDLIREADGLMKIFGAILEKTKNI
jgi:NAD(P)-dependent dehydrogenase (short-subunit alcohol dehydrogenase family)